MRYNKLTLFLCLLVNSLSAMGFITLTVVGGVVTRGSVSIQWTRTSTTDSTDFFISCINTAQNVVEQVDEVFLFSNTTATGMQGCIIDTAEPYQFTATGRTTGIILAKTPVFPVVA